MATAFAHTHSHQHITTTVSREKKTAKRGVVATFLSDLIEDVRQKPLQAAEFAKHDMFREHINAMSISYFALIVLLIGASIPVLAYVVSN